MGRHHHSHYRHARRRALLRYGIDLTPAEEQRLIGLARARGVVFLRESNTRLHIAVWDETRAIWLPIVYSSASGHIVTLLPPYVLLEHAEKLQASNYGGPLQDIEPYPFI